LLIFSWLLFQYSRIVNYRSCRTVALSTTPQVICDCQKQAPEATAAEKQHTTENAGFRPRPEDAFITVSLPHPANAVGQFRQNGLNNTPVLLAGCQIAVFQPPRGNVSHPLFI
jgi:hypothetical protein